MKCKFKTPTGKKCSVPTIKNKEYCFLHDRNSVSVYFISDFENNKKGDVILGVDKARGMHLIENNIAIKLDRKLYSRTVDKIL